MHACIHATSFLSWVSILQCAITVVWVLVILGTLGSQRFSQILEETLDIISFMWVHWDTWDNSRSHHEIGVVLGNVFVQILFPKHLFTPRTLYWHIRTGFCRFWIFPPYRLQSTFVRWCQEPVWFHLLEQYTIECRLRCPALKPHIAWIYGVCVPSQIDAMQVSNTAQHTWELRFQNIVASKPIILTL